MKSSSMTLSSLPRTNLAVLQMGRRRGESILRLEEHAGRCEAWPPYVRTPLLAFHLKYADRFKCCLFFLGNGVAPCVIQECLDPFLRDLTAHKHVYTILLSFLQGALKGKEYYDVLEKRKEVLHPPPFCLRSHAKYLKKIC